jgi:hypothetical protein
LVLICMIVLAMPVQGIAAATMRFCATGGQAHAHHAVAVQPAHHHHDRLVTDTANQQSKAGTDATSKMKCSVCAVCCMAAAIAPDVPAVHVIEASSKITLPAPVSYVGPVADGLERPPRPLLA